MLMRSSPPIVTYLAAFRMPVASLVYFLCLMPRVPQEAQQEAAKLRGELTAAHQALVAAKLSVAGQGQQQEMLQSHLHSLQAQLVSGQAALLQEQVRSTRHAMCRMWACSCDGRGLYSEASLRTPAASSCCWRPRLCACVADRLVAAFAPPGSSVHNPNGCRAGGAQTPASPGPTVPPIAPVWIRPSSGPQ